MEKIRIICIGKLKEKYLCDACNEYVKRLKSYCNLSIIELNENKIPDNPSASEIEKSLEKEGKEILSKIGEKSFKIMMCIEGKQFPSVNFAKLINEKISFGVSEIDFIIGGSFGLSDEVKSKADLKLSMSEMTFPHQLARVMLLEQIYRTFSIISGGKYHK